MHLWMWRTRGYLPSVASEVLAWLRCKPAKPEACNGEQEALRDGWSRRKLSMDALWHCASIDRVANVMRPYLESVTR
jgi:hypothetical protein